MEQRVDTVIAVDPLMTPLILSNIFNRLTMKAQKEFRQVNTIWEEASVSQWRKCALIKIEMPADETTVLKDGSHVQGFVKLWKGSSPEHDGDAHPHPITKQPFRRFNLCWPENRAPYQDILLTNSSLREFWELCSPQMEYLQMTGFYAKECFFQTMKWILLEGERSVLKELNLKYGSFHGCEECCKNDHDLSKRNGKVSSESVGSSRMEAPVLRRKTAEALTNLSMYCYLPHIVFKTTHLQELFRIIPNLKTLSTNRRCTSDVIIEGLAASTETMTNKIKLESLKITPDADSFSSLLKYVKDSKTEIKTLTLKLGYLCSDGDFISAYHRFLDSCSSTLSKLKIIYYQGIEDENWITDFNGLLFPQLTELHIWVSAELHWPYSDDEFKLDFRGLCGMPALKIFAFEKTPINIKRDKMNRREISEEELSYDDGGITERMGDKKFNQDLSSLRLDHLEYFKLHMHRRLGVDSLRKVASWMRNLKRAELALNDETFPVIKEFWPNLEELTLLIKGKVKGEIIQRERIVNDNGPVRIWIERSDIFNEYYTSDDESLFSASSDEEEASSLK